MYHVFREYWYYVVTIPLPIVVVVVKKVKMKVRSKKIRRFRNQCKVIPIIILILIRLFFIITHPSIVEELLRVTVQGETVPPATDIAPVSRIIFYSSLLLNFPKFKPTIDSLSHSSACIYIRKSYQQ